jgi:hypothetical protein
VFDWLFTRGSVCDTKLTVERKEFDYMALTQMELWPRTNLGSEPAQPAILAETKPAIQPQVSLVNKGDARQWAAVLAFWEANTAETGPDANWPKLLPADDTDIFVAYAQDQVVGLGIAKRYDKYGSVNVCRLVTAPQEPLDPEAQAELIQAMVAHYQAANFGQIYSVVTTEDDIRARLLYIEHGFKPDTKFKVPENTQATIYQI